MGLLVSLSIYLLLLCLSVTDAADDEDAGVCVSEFLDLDRFS